MNLPPQLKSYLTDLWEQSDADYRRKLLAALPPDPTARLLDVGCDDGSWTAQVAGRLGTTPDRVAGIEVVDERRALAAARGYDVRTGDLEGRWPFDEAAFDVVHANQVIEHVKRLDHFLDEAVRVLAPGGLLVVCTENLAAWSNVAALALGFMPFSLTNISRHGAIGNPFALHQGEQHQFGESWQHLHVVTLGALRQLVAAAGLREETVFGAGYEPIGGRLASRLATAHTRRAHFIGITARR